MTLYFTIDGLNRSNCEYTYQKYKKNKMLGKGAYGSVHEACINDDCSYVMKVVTYIHQKYEMIGGDFLSRKYIKDGWKKEILSMMRIMNCQKKYGIKFSPNLYDAWHCNEENGDTTFYIVMEKYDGNLLEFIKNHKREKLTKTVVSTSLKSLELALIFIHTNCNICLNDIKLENILYKEIDGVYHFIFADFGLTSIATDDICKKEDFRRFHDTVTRFLSNL